MAGRRRAECFCKTDASSMTDNALTVMPTKCATCEVLQQAPLICADCHSLLAHVQGADYFELFGLTRRYDIDEAELNRKYLAISRNIHPDRFGGAGPEMQSFALRASAAINQAYDVLRDPHRRAEYLLESSGGKSSAEDKRVPPDLLGKVMMLREEIEDARAAGDTAAISTMRASIEQDRSAAQQRIGALCAELIANGSEATKGELRMQLNAMKYLDNLLAQL